MATLDRIEPAYTAWSPSSAGIGVTEDDEYIGRHRTPTGRGFSLHRMFYSARHRMSGRRHNR